MGVIRLDICSVNGRACVTHVQTLSELFTPATVLIFSEVPAALEVRQPRSLVALYILDHLQAAGWVDGGVFPWANSRLSYVGKVRGRMLCHLLFQ